MAGSPQKPAFVRTFNQVIGQIQLRQTRYQKGECQVGTELSAYYRQECHTAGAISSLPYGVDKGNLTDKAFLAGYGLVGQMSPHNSARFFSWLDVRRPTVGQARAKTLKVSKFIDDGSRSLEVTIVFFNSEIQAYGHIRIELLLMRGGLIKVDMKARTLWATMFTHWYHYVIDLVWVLSVLKFIANSVQKAADNKEAKSCCSRCCKLHPKLGGGYWLALDWMGIVLALGIMIFLIIFLAGFSSLAAKVGSLGMGPEPMLGNSSVNHSVIMTNESIAEAAAQALRMETMQGNFYATNAEIIEDIESLMELKVMQRLGMFWYTMIFLLRWFRGFKGQARISQITSTLTSALADLLHFAIIFGVLFINFALAGHVLFGSEVTEWSTITKALQSALGMAWGRVDYAPLQEIAPLSSLIWLLGYVITMVMLSMNMLLAIITDHYGGVFHASNAGDKGYDIFGQMKAMLYECWWNFAYVARYIYRIVYPMFPTRVKGFWFTPFFEPEEVRLAIPYEQMHCIGEDDPLGYVTANSLRRAGCDRATAEHLLKKCENEVLRHLDEFYPLELLFDEFDESMKQYYYAMDSFSGELRTWFSDKSVNARRMLPRQAKMDFLSKQIQVAQHIEHKHHHHHNAAHMEGDGVHHHHHRTKRDGDTDSRHESSQAGSHSQSVSQSQSRALSRAPSQHNF